MRAAISVVPGAKLTVVRVTRFWALVSLCTFFVWPHFIWTVGWSKEVTKSLETYRDQIGKSQVLLLQRERLQSAQLLISAIDREAKNSNAYEELKKALKKTSDTFFTERAQQTYELGLSLYITNKSQSLDRLNESLMQEPLNGLLLRSLAFVALSQRDCSSAQGFLAEHRKINPVEPELEKLHLLERICFKNKTERPHLLAILESVGAERAFLQVNRVRIGFDETTEKKALKSETEVKTNAAPNDDYPEVTYVGWRNQVDQDKKKILANRYKSLCQSAVSFDKAYSWMDPWVCENRKEIEEFLNQVEKMGKT